MKQNRNVRLLYLLEDILNPVNQYYNKVSVFERQACIRVTTIGRSKAQQTRWREKSSSSVCRIALRQDKSKTDKLAAKPTFG